MLDGRTNMHERPPSLATTGITRAFSTGSQSTAAISDTLSRIEVLERELNTARAEREALESSVAALKSEVAA
jgi:cell division protein FtsB